MPKISVLLVDDDASLRQALTDEMTRSGFSICPVPDGESAIAEAEARTFDVAIVDLNLPGLSGQDLILALKERLPTLEIVVLTGHATVESAVRTLKDGAYDFLTKPCNLDELETTLRKAYEKRALIRENKLLHRELARHDRFREFVGKSTALSTVLDLITKVSRTNSTVLVQGESGVGKELAARAIHRNSHRSRQPIIVVDCTSLQEFLLQSELFGHEKGAFTGAVARKHGLFEAADSGTLFLDEIGEISLSLQSRILRVLDMGTFRRVGGLKDVRVDVRVICATNRDLYQMVREGRFREDLYYRINVVSITLPPLRERHGDVPLLARYFSENSPVARRDPVDFTPEAMAALGNYSWPGNVRELHNVVERALILAEGSKITPNDLPGNLRESTKNQLKDLTARRPALAELEKAYISDLLKEHGGHRAKVAQVLGISERTLYRKLKTLSIPSSQSED